MTESKLSREWAHIFSKELGGVQVVIEESNHPQAQTVVENQNGRSTAHIRLSNTMNSEVGKMAQLRHEHGLLEFDSFNLKIPEVRRLGPELVNVIESVRINVAEAERYQGFKDGYAKSKALVTTKTAKLVYNATQDKPENPDEEYIFELARAVNETEGGRRGEHRGKEFYEKYGKLVKSIIRYMGNVPPSPTPPPGDKPGGDGTGEGESDGNGSPGDKPGDGKGKPDGKEPKKNESRLRLIENMPIQTQEEVAAKQEAASGSSECQQLGALHPDIGRGGEGAGLGGIMNLNRVQPPVDPNVLAMVAERFRKIRMGGTKHMEAGGRLNMRVAMRAQFTGETNLFKNPARTDIRNAKFVILQDISGSMASGMVTVGGKAMRNCDLAYNFGLAMEEFLTKNGAQVQSFRFNSGPFMEGLSLECEGGTSFDRDNINMILGWIKERAQVIILTDGAINIDMSPDTLELFNRSGRKPVGMQLGGCYGGGLEEVDKDWKKYEVQNDPVPALDNIVREFSKRFRW